MKCIVPLAGPDFYSDKYGIKPMTKYTWVRGDETKCTSLLQAALESRAWWQHGDLLEEDLVFVLNNQNRGCQEFRDFLDDKYPDSSQVAVSNFTRGALLTALGGSAVLRQLQEPIIIDLADILFNSQLKKPSELFSSNPLLGAIAPYFESENPKYSYLKLEGEYVSQAIEKKVISNFASAGVYIFRNLAVFLNAAAHSINNEESLGHKGSMYLCPAYNGVASMGLLTRAVRVTAVDEISRKFH